MGQEAMQGFQRFVSASKNVLGSVPVCSSRGGDEQLGRLLVYTLP